MGASHHDSEPEQNRKLFIGGLDYKTNEESLKSHFEQWGEIVDCVVMKDPSTKRSRGFGFVTYKHASNVDDVQNARPHKIDGREVETKRAVPRENESPPEVQNKKLFIGGIDYSTNEESLRSYFETWGEIIDCVVMKEPRTKKSRGFGFVTYKDASNVDDAQNARPHTVDGREVQTKRALPREESGNPEAQATVKKIFIGGVKENIEEEDLREYFGQFGTISTVNVITDKETGKKRGFAFIEYDDYDPVDKVVLKRHHMIKDRRMDVKKALSRQEMDSVKRNKEMKSSRDSYRSRSPEPFGRGYGGYSQSSSLYSDDYNSGGWGHSDGGYGNSSYNSGGSSWGNDFGSSYGSSYGGGPVRSSGGRFSQDKSPYGGGGYSGYSGGGGGGGSRSYGRGGGGYRR